MCGRQRDSDGTEGKFLHQAIQAGLAALEVVVVAEAEQPADSLYPGLVWIDLPGMKIEDGRTLAGSASQQGPAEPVGVEAEIAAAGRGQALAQQRCRGQREFGQQAPLGVRSR